MSSFEIKQSLTPREVYWLTMYRALLKGKKIRMLLIAVPVFLGVLMGVIQTQFTSYNQKFLTPFLALMLIAFYGIIFLFKYKRNRNQQPYKLILHPESIECVSNTKTTRINWSEIACYTEFPQHLLLISYASAKTITLLIRKDAYMNNHTIDLIRHLQEQGIQKQ